GSIGQAQYEARLAALAAQLRAVERRANQTATVADALPEQALRAQGADVSEVRSVAQQANRAGGGEVAEAARKIAGEDVGNGLGPPNASARGPPDSMDPSERSRPDQNDSTTGAPAGVGGDGQNRTENRSSPGDVDRPVTEDSPANSIGGTNETVRNDSSGAQSGGSEAPNGTNGSSTGSTTGTPTPSGNSETERDAGADDDAPRDGDTTVTATTTP
ncbi:MAG: hypothetical protein ACOCQL_04945, partial [Halolamina sp.]